MNKFFRSLLFKSLFTCAAYAEYEPILLPNENWNFALAEETSSHPTRPGPSFSIVTWTGSEANLPPSALANFPTFNCQEYSCPPPAKERSATWQSKLRVRALKDLDQLLNWTTSQKLKTYILATPHEEQVFETDIPEMHSFIDNYGYYSLIHPIVSRVTYGIRDLEIICCLLQALYEKSPSIEYLEIAIAEVITKALAYHDLKIDQTVMIPVLVEGKYSLEPFYVDYIFNMWHGMPAFGLVPERQGVASLLLFRGTDFSLNSPRGWASLISDLDFAGPGYRAFQYSQLEIGSWLRSVKADGKAARVMGFSLGGVLAAYTFIYENQWLSDRGSISICGPGIRESVLKKWQLLSKERQKGFTTYVNMGDITSKVGKLFGNVFALSAQLKIKPLTAHVTLMSSEPKFSKARVDVQKENQVR